MSPATTSALAAVLDHAQLTGRPIDPLRHAYDLDADSAYAIQAELARLRSARGARRVGRKVGLTSVAVQQQLGVDRPDFGILFDEMQIPDGGAADIDQLIQPRIEAEVAFVLAEDLVGELDEARVRAAIAYAQPALEIVDSRIQDWDIGFVDTVADNGSSALFVLGSDRRRLDEVEPKSVQMTMQIDGVTRSEGTGDACLGDPVLAVLWLARTAQAHGDPLRAGDVVLSGALGPMVAVAVGNHVTATVSGFGTVSVRFETQHPDTLWKDVP